MSESEILELIDKRIVELIKENLKLEVRCTEGGYIDIRVFYKGDEICSDWGSIID